MNRFRTLLLTLWLSMICTVVYSHNTLQTQYCGLQDGGTYGMVDNLTYYYNGNQLMRVSDSVEDPSYVGAFNFKDGANTGAEYAYDANGNMVIDYNKGITSITYNTINMPQKITFSDGKTTEYVYSYDGTKLQTKHTTPIPQTSTTTTYSGNLIYENGALKRLLVDGGYVTFNGTTPKYHFYIQDHLGNNRVVADEDGNIEQINHYYPFGGLMADISTNSDAQTYKYNGKELDRMHGLDTYDYGARQHNAATGRWDRMDQLAEENPEVSPYVYCLNNPMNAIDPNGKKTVLYATTLPGLFGNIFSPPTHTFIVVFQQGKPRQYFAYGGEHTLYGKLERFSYKQDIDIIDGKDTKHLKNMITITPPKGMNENEFDQKVIDTAKSFGNEEDFSYSILPTNESEGNCNTSTSTILYKSGISQDALNKYGKEIDGWDYGFGIIKAWTKEEQREAINNDIEKIKKDIENETKFNWYY